MEQVAVESDISPEREQVTHIEESASMVQPSGPSQDRPHLILNIALAMEAVKVHSEREKEKNIVEREHHNKQNDPAVSSGSVIDSTAPEPKATDDNNIPISSTDNGGAAKSVSTYHKDKNSMLRVTAYNTGTHSEHISISSAKDNKSLETNVRSTQVHSSVTDNKNPTHSLSQENLESASVARELDVPLEPPQSPTEDFYSRYQSGTVPSVRHQGVHHVRSATSIEDAMEHRAWQTVPVTARTVGVVESKRDIRSLPEVGLEKF